jgi:TonB family protein
MENKRQKSKSERLFFLLLALSLLLHLLLIVVVYKVPIFRSLPPSAPPSEEVVFVRPEDVITAPPQGLELADLAKPKLEKIPEKARFASPYNSTVKEETVARKIPKNARPDVQVSEEPEKRVTKEKPSKEQQVAKAGESPTKPEEPSLSDLQVKTSDYKDLAKEFGSKTGKKDEKEPGPELASLPRFNEGGPGDRFVHDFMPSVKIGDKTYLNAFAMPNVQYFTQLKRIFRLSFSPERPLISYFHYNRVVVGSVNVIMAMEVSRSGNLTKLFVVKSSGIPGYDEEALRTVRASSPFAAPPAAILSTDGVLRMTWHFTTYL